MFLLLLGIALSLPFVQTWIAHYGTEKVNKEFGTHIQIDKVAISVFGGVKLKGVLILDHHNDTLIAADRLQTNILNARGFLDSKLRFGIIRAHKLNFHMKTYKGEKTSNLDVFVKSFDNGKPGSGKFRLRTDELYVTDGRFRLTNQNAVTARVLDLKKLNGQLNDFYIKGSDVSADIRKLSLLDHRGLFVNNLKAKFSYSKTNIKLDNLELVTAESALTGKVKLTYTIADMKDFVNRVKFDFKVDRASVSSNELNYFYNEFGKDQKFYLSTRLTGPLNDFVLHDLKLLDSKDSEIIGSVNFRHLFDKKGPGFYMNANFDRVTSNYSNLRNIMPRILGKSLPVILEKFGRIDLVGDVVLTKTDITTNLYVMSELGEATADLSVKDYNKPDVATYLGTIDLEGFNVGGLLNNKMVGLATLHVDVNGQGFNKKSLNTTVQGNIASLVANKYRYKNIKIDGQFKWPYFNGRINSNDPNLRMSFDGLVDMSTNRIKYDFNAKVDYADLHILNLVKKDTLAIFKGNIIANASGNSINTLAGRIQVSELYYQNSRDSYFFDDFSVEASYDNNNVRTVVIDSKDIIEGSISGIYDIKEVPKLVQNALGSLYTNYSPFKVKKGQFFDFNFTIYNKIVEIVSPEIIVGDNTVVKGRIDGDKGEFVLGFNSPIITAFSNEFDNINIDINNKNTLYNSYVSMDTIKLNKYKISDFRAVNITKNDTLHVRTEFKGGTGKDFFHLNLYHTIDKDNKSIVGFKKSEVSLKDYIWYINEENEDDNKIVFNKKLTDFSIERITMSHNDQLVRLGGIIRGKDFKDVKLSFSDVDLDKITPSLDSLSFSGRLNGEVSLKQEKQEFQPAASITIDSLKVNKFNIGDLALQVTGDKSFRKFNLNTSIARNDEENFYASGAVEIVDKQTLMSLDVKFTDFDISPLQMFLKSIFPEIRGKASGQAAIVGNVKNPEINGVIYLKKAGLKVGYLNTDYNFEENAMVTLSDKAIVFRPIELTDVKYKTKGILSGTVKHTLFKNWELDNIKINSDRILVLDTPDSDDAMYYGTAFIKGEASIDGPVNALFIKVEAESKTGTDIKIPINNSGTSTNNAAFIHFLTPKEKENRLKGIIADIDKSKTFKGLEMEFNLNITPEAKIEVIIDKNTGHSLSATGDGYMLLQINTLGKFNMIGDYIVRKGVYNFKYAGLIDKKITVKQGGTINWEGDPKRARLNLEAVYSLRANPSVLLEASSFNRNIPVEVSILLTGNLTNPEPDFAINFPGVSSVLKSDLEYKLTDITNRQTQALSLLSTGSFVNPNNMNAGTAVAGNLFERASSLVNGIFAEDDSKVNIGLNYVQAEKNPYVETNSQVGLTVSSQINDRITVNGQLGVPIGGVNESQIVGNVEVQIRLNDENSLKGRVFNRENDISFLGEGIGYTQGIGLSYSVDFDTIRELWKKIFSKTDDKESDNTNSDGIPDSELSPDYIKFIEGRNKKKTNTTEKSSPRIPDEDNHN